MIVSQTPNRVNSRWLQACVLLCAVLVLPFPAAYAQNFDAVERRLGQGVAEGELTLRQAAVMMDALRRAGGAKKDQEPDRAREWLMKVRKDLGAAVKAGKISREDAAKRLAAAEKAIRERMAAGRRQPQAKKDQEPDRARADAYVRDVWAKLQAAVKAGKMSQEDAHKKMGEVKKAVASRLKNRDDRGHDRDDRDPDKDDRARVDAHLWAVWAKLQAAVKAGKMSQEDAHKKMGEVKKAVASRLKNRDDRGHDKGDRDPDRGDRARVDAYLRAVWAKLQAAVKAGKMSEEDAAAKMTEIKKKVLGKKSPRSK